MFDLVRNHKRWMLFLVLILILPSFVFFGIEGYTRFMEGDQALAKVNGAAVTRAEYDAARRSQLDRARQTMGAQFDPLRFDTPAMRQQTLEQLINARVLAMATADGHFTVSDNALRQAIAGIPAVQKDGRFNAEMYNQALAAQGISPAQFEASMRYDLAEAQVLQPVLESGSAPRTLVRSLLEAMMQERTVQLRAFRAQDFEASVQVSDADIKAYYEANAARFNVPEKIDAQYLLLDSEAVIKDVSVSDDELAAYYEQNKGRFTNEESRRISHILIQTGDDAAAARKQAESLAEQARQNPAAFADLAREHSQDPGSAQAGGSLGWITRDTFVPELEKIVFSLKQGEVSGVAESDFGFHVLKLDEVRPASSKPLDEVREQLAQEIRMQKAGERFGDAAGKLTDLVYDSADSLEPAADALNLKIQTASGIARDDPGENAPELFDDARVRLALFSAEVAREGRNSGVIELAPDRLVAVRAEKVVPAHSAPLKDVSDDIRALLTQERALAAAEEAGKKALEALQSGQAASGFGDELTVSRRNPGNIGSAALAAIMGVAPDATLPAYTGALTSDGYMIAKVNRIEAAEAPADEIVAAEADSLGFALAQEQADAYLQALRQHYKVEMEPLAAQVLNESESD